MASRTIFRRRGRFTSADGLPGRYPLSFALIGLVPLGRGLLDLHQHHDDFQGSTQFRVLVDSQRLATDLALQPRFLGRFLQRRLRWRLARVDDAFGKGPPALARRGNQTEFQLALAIPKRQDAGLIKGVALRAFLAHVTGPSYSVRM